LSNLLDRIAFGTVVDFLNLNRGGFRPYIFNLADVAIGIGLALTLLGLGLHAVRFAVVKSKSGVPA